MIKRYIKEVFAVLIMGVLFLNFASAEKAPCEMHQIFTVDDVNVLRVRFNITANPPIHPSHCVPFRLRKEYNATNFSAYSITDNISLAVNNETENDSIRFYLEYWQSQRVPSEEPEPHTVIIDFDSFGFIKESPLGRYNLYWNWGGVSYNLPLKYTFKINKKFQYHEEYSSCPQCNISQEGDYTIISVGGIAKNNSYFPDNKIHIAFKNFKPPSLKVSKRLVNPGSISVDENVIIHFTIRNNGDSIAKNITILPYDPPMFKPFDEQDLTMSELKPGDVHQLPYYLKALTRTEVEEYLGPDSVKFYDVWGRDYSIQSNGIGIRVEGKKITLPFLGIAVAEEKFLSYLYNFILGYCILFYIVVIRQKQFDSWKSIPFFDKSIVSVVLAILNFAVVIAFSLILLVTYSMVAQLFDLESNLFELPEWTITYVFPILLYLTTFT